MKYKDLIICTNVGGTRSNNGRVENGNAGGQGTTLTTVPVGTTVSPKLLAVPMNDAGIDNRGPQGLAGMIL